MRDSFRWVLAGVVPILLLAGCSSRRLDLSQPSAQLNFGVKAAEMDLWREARFRFERAVELNPSDPMALNNLAVAYEGSGDFEKARETYLRALKVDQSNPYIQKNYSRFMEFHQRNRKREAADSPAVPKTASTPVDGAAEPPDGLPAPAAPPPETSAPPEGPISEPPAPAPSPAVPAVPATTQPPVSEGADR